MKQILHDFRTGKVILADVPQPAPQANEVLVHNLFSVVSPGTERAVIQSRSRNLVRTALKRKDLVARVMAKAKRDGLLATMKVVSRKLDNVLALGYSSAGIVVAVGSEITDLAPGDRVSCAGAGFASHAEYVSVPRMLCARIPDGVEYDAAAFTTLGAIAVQGIRQADSRFGETVAVIGLGIMGQITAQILESAGVECIGLDLDPERVKSFKQICSGHGVLANDKAQDEVAAITEGRGVDSVIVTAASESNTVIELASEICCDRARIVMVGNVGMNIPRHLFYGKDLELRVSRSYGPGRYDPTYELGGIDYPIAYVRWTENRNMQTFLQMLQKGSVSLSGLVSHRFGIGEADTAYEGLNQSDIAPMGVLISYPQDAKEEAPQRVEIRPRPKRDGKIGVALLGAGNFARAQLLPAIRKNPNARLVAVGSARGVNAHDLATKVKCEFCTTDFAEILASDSVDAVIISTPHNLHAEQVLQAVAADRSVYVEKPLCIDQADMSRLEPALRASKGCVFVGYNRRFSPLGIRMRDVFAARRTPITLNYCINAGQISPDSWVVNPDIGGGRIVGEACHFVDFAKFIIGAPIRNVQAFPTGESADDVTGVLHFSDGSVATISYLTNGPSSLPKERIEVVGAGKACTIEDFRHWTLHEGKSVERKKCTQNKGHAQSLKTFIDCVAGREQSPFLPECLIETSAITFQMRGDAPKAGAHIVSSCP
jgi:predicted dehydrogenase/threonine dehydrogenase-like Zn-dependent dehydrogenase